MLLACPHGRKRVAQNPACHPSRVHAQAQRIVGSDLAFPCGGGAPGGDGLDVFATDCNPADPTQQFTAVQADHTIESLSVRGWLMQIHVLD